MTKSKTWSRCISAKFVRQHSSKDVCGFSQTSFCDKFKVGPIVQPQKGPFGVAERQKYKDNRLYIGCTSKNPNERLQQHNAGMVKSTKYRAPFKLLYTEKFDNKNVAFKREWYLKHPQGYKEKIEIVRKITEN